VTALRGTGVSPGIAVGPALIVEHEVGPVFRLALAPEQIPGEVERLQRALATSADQLRAIKERLSREVGAPHAYIFDAHLLMLEDSLLGARAVELVREQAVNAEWALRTVSESLHALFSEFSDAYLRERSTDLDDVIGRVQLNLRGAPGAPTLARLPEPVVLVAGDLRPSEAAELDWDRVLAIVTDVGSSTYHTAIIARSLGIPAVAGLEEATRLIPPGGLVAVDGARGEVVVEPKAEALARLRAAQVLYRREEERLRGTRGLAAVTADGVAVGLEANVEFPEEAATAQQYGAEGIGLFRSEYLLGRGLRFPTEEQQLDVYRRLVEQMHPFPVTVRTWDVGGEAFGPAGPSSPNPALGERALRLMQRSADPFRVQLRALLRAARHGELRIMFPFVSSVEQLREARAMVAAAAADLERRGEAVPHVPIGVMIEIPAAAYTADLLAREVDFFTIGTNDLIQYCLAVDRADERVSRLYEPLHPAILRTILMVSRAARRRHIPVSLCGEMASDPALLTLLVGLGLTELSMTPGAIGVAKQVLSEVRSDELRALARRVLRLSTIDDIERELLTAIGKLTKGVTS
jgi:phosphoenolpyruvate-protein phosphotransferase (PTS system enzyme I)